MSSAISAESSTTWEYMYYYKEGTSCGPLDQIQIYPDPGCQPQECRYSMEHKCSTIPPPSHMDGYWSVTFFNNSKCSLDSIEGAVYIPTNYTEPTGQTRFLWHWMWIQIIFFGFVVWFSLILWFPESKCFDASFITYTDLYAKYTCDGKKATVKICKNRLCTNCIINTIIDKTDVCVPLCSLSPDTPCPDEAKDIYVTYEGCGATISDKVCAILPIFLRQFIYCWPW